MISADSLARALAILEHIGGLALIAFGGVITVLPAIHREFVEHRHWLTDHDFVTLFAIAQASPGPNVLVLTLIGLQAAGIVGAIAATLALAVPTSLVAYGFVQIWDRFREAHWRKATQAGLLPVTIGFISAASFIIARGSDATPLAYAVSIVTLAIAVFTKINPLWMFLVGGALGLAGLM